MPAVPLTCTGLEAFAFVPLPSCPLPFAPQASTVPSGPLMANEDPLPAAIAVISAAPLTWTGVSLWVFVPSPSWPLPFAPQAHTVPSDLRARVCVVPAAIAVTPEPLPRPDVCTGAACPKNVPSPSCPLLLSPHASTVGLEGKREGVGGSDRRHARAAAEPRDLDRSEPLEGGSVTKLPAAVGPPGQHRAVGFEGKSMAVAGEAARRDR